MIRSCCKPGWVPVTNTCWTVCTNIWIPPSLKFGGVGQHLSCVIICGLVVTLKIIAFLILRCLHLDGFLNVTWCSLPVNEHLRSPLNCLGTLVKHEGWQGFVKVQYISQSKQQTRKFSYQTAFIYIYMHVSVTGNVETAILK